MKTRILLCLSLMAASAFAQTEAVDLRWELAYADTGKSCDVSYSLYPMSVKCIRGKLYAVRYKVSYIFQGNRKTVYTDYIPEKDAPLDVDGNLLPLNHSIKQAY